jgi:plastocyanin
MTAASSSMYARIAGVLTLGVFAANVYIGLYDKVLQEVKVHWYLDWVIAAATLISAGLLLAKPSTRWTVVLGGVVWPVVYVSSLGFDVYTKLCAGVSQNYCLSSRTVAFQYLILNNPNAQGQRWTLFHYTVPLALGLIFIAWVLSIVTVISIRRSSARPPPVRLVAAAVIVAILILVSALAFVSPTTTSSTTSMSTETTLASTSIASSEGLSSTSSTSSSSTSTNTTLVTSSLTSSQTSSSSLTTTISKSTSSSASTESIPGGAQLTISGFAFYPTIATVIIGMNNTVTWTNKDYATHTVTSNSGLFDSGILGYSQSWNYTFTTPGNYSYYCSNHPWMLGSVVVLAALPANPQRSMLLVPGQAVLTILQATIWGMCFILVSVAHLAKQIRVPQLSRKLGHSVWTSQSHDGST